MRIKKKNIRIFGIVILILVIGYISIYAYVSYSPFKIKDDGRISYEVFKGRNAYSISQKEVNETFEIYEIKYPSRNYLDKPAIIYGIYIVPVGKNNLPGVVLLPGGGVSSYEEMPTAIKIAEMGYAVFVIDQRGIGKTEGFYPTIEMDYSAFLDEKESIHHLSVYDAIRAVEVISDQKQVNKNKIALVGESMGGRYAIIAASIDKNVRGVVGIATSGFHVKITNDKKDRYFYSFDPDAYIKDVSPRKIVMIHSTNDSKVRYEDAMKTYLLANEPKRFYTHSCNSHGYCNEMKDSLSDSLKFIFE